MKPNGWSCSDEDSVLQERIIEGEDIMEQYFPDVPISNVMKLDGIANRNSLPYADMYGLQPLADVRTMFRGTLR